MIIIIIIIIIIINIDWLYTYFVRLLFFDYNYYCYYSETSDWNSCRSQYINEINKRINNNNINNTFEDNLRKSFLIEIQNLNELNLSFLKVFDCQFDRKKLINNIIKPLDCLQLNSDDIEALTSNSCDNNSVIVKDALWKDLWEVTIIIILLL